MCHRGNRGRSYGPVAIMYDRSTIAPCVCIVYGGMCRGISLILDGNLKNSVEIERKKERELALFLIIL